jgi:hypothetical protein
MAGKASEATMITQATERNREFFAGLDFQDDTIVDLH